MAKDKVLDRKLSTEERQWLRDLSNHQGYHLLVAVVQELMAQDLNLVLNSQDWAQVQEYRGCYKRSLKILGLPKELQEVTMLPPFTSEGKTS